MTSRAEQYNKRKFGIALQRACRKAITKYITCNTDDGLEEKGLISVHSVHLQYVHWNPYFSNLKGWFEKKNGLKNWGKIVVFD